MPTHYMSRLFGTSPVRPIQQHFEAAARCADELLPFFEQVCVEDWDGARRHRERITELENEADDLKRELRLNLPKSLFMPVSRSDILDLLSMQDRIANKAKDISGLVTGRRMAFPDALKEDYRAFLKRSLDAVGQARKSVNELDELFETGFRGTEVELVMAMTEELDRIEHESDELQIKLRRKLFEIEKDLPPIDAMFLYKIIDWTGDLGDLAHRVGSRLHLMMAR